MAETPVYDRQADEEHAPQQAVDRDDLRDAEEDGGFFNPDGDQGELVEDDQVSDSPEGGDTGTDSGGGEGGKGTTGNGSKPDKRGKSGGDEKQAAGGDSEGGLYNDDEAGAQRGGLRGRYARARNKAANVRNRAMNNRLLVGFGIGGGVLCIVLFVLLILLVGSLKIPNLMQHITEYQFARVTRQAALTSQNLTEEKIALDATDNVRFAALKERYQNLRGQTWGKFDRFRPNLIIKNMQSEGTFNVIYDKPGLSGRQRVKAVTVGDTSYLPKQQTRATRYVPLLRDVVDFKNNVSFARNVRPALTESLRANNIGPIVRGRIYKQVRKELGISLIAWTASRYTGKSEREARIAETQDSYKKIADDGVDPAKTPQIKDAEEAAKQAEKEAMADPKQVQEIIDHRGVSQKVIDAINAKLKPSDFQTGVGYFNSTFGIALAGCTIYDGSLTQSGPTINSQTASQQKAFHYGQTAADMQKYGHAPPEAVGAANAHFGDITQTNPEIRASGGRVNTSSSISSEGSAGGDMSILDVVLGGSFGGAIDALAGPGCEFLLNPVVAFGGAAAGAVLAVVTGGGSAAVEEGVNVASQNIVKRLVTNIAERFASKQATKETVGAFNAKARALIGDTSKSIVKVGGLTILAKLIVMDKAHVSNNGTEQGPDFVHMADAGGNSTGSEVNQRQFYGRPLSREEAGEDKAANEAYVAYQNSRRSTFDRYLALDNADSLLNHTGTMMASAIHKSPFASLLTLGGKPFSPTGSLYGLFGSFLTPRSLAAATYNAAVDDYGNVQWGYSAKELALLSNHPTYRSHLENQSILDSSGQADAIEAKYGKCFDGSKKIGDMLADGDIVRDKDGNVEPDKGLCSPNNLSVDNAEFGPQMVFRWRVAHSYDNQLEQLNDEQTIGAPSDDTSADDSAVVPGEVQAVAKDILANSNIGYLYSAKEDVQLVADGKPGTNGVPIDPRALQLVAALGKSHKVVVSAYESHGQGHSVGSDHYTGHAVDIATIDGTVAYQNITDFYDEFKAYADGAVFLQGDCPGAKPSPAGMNRLRGDACNHQHISFK